MRSVFEGEPLVGERLVVRWLVQQQLVASAPLGGSAGLVACSAVGVCSTGARNATAPCMRIPIIIRCRRTVRVVRLPRRGLINRLQFFGSVYSQLATPIYGCKNIPYITT